MSRPARRRRLRQRLLDAVHEPDRAAARPGPRRGRRGLRRRPGEAPRGRRAAGPHARPARRRRGLRAPGRRRGAGAHEHDRARPARARGARGGQARAGREAGGDDAARRPSRCSRPPRPRPGHLLCAPHILLSPTYRAMHARVRARRDRRAAHRARPATAGPARTGAAGSTSPAAARCSTSASTTSRACAASSGPARRVTAMTGVAIPERVVDGEPIRVRGRGQCARAARLRRRALRGRHDRLHDAALPLAVHRALRHPRRAADARRRLGARGLRAVAQRRAPPGSCTRRPTPRGRGRTGCATSSSASRPARRR